MHRHCVKRVQPVRTQRHGNADAVLGSEVLRFPALETVVQDVDVRQRGTWSNNAHHDHCDNVPCLAAKTQRRGGLLALTLGKPRRAGRELNVNGVVAVQQLFVTQHGGNVRVAGAGREVGEAHAAGLLVAVDADDVLQVRQVVAADLALLSPTGVPRQRLSQRHTHETVRSITRAQCLGQGEMWPRITREGEGIQGNVKRTTSKPRALQLARLGIRPWIISS